MARLLLATGSPDLGARIAAATEGNAAVVLAGVARNRDQALALAIDLNPDIIAVDLDLLHGDNAEIVREIMIAAPRPVVVIASPDRVKIGFIPERTLDVGALAVIAAPVATNESLEKFLSTISAMSQVKVVRHRRKKPPAETHADNIRRDDPAHPVSVIGIAASTGGPTALRAILRKIPAGFPAPILVVQHMSDGFIEGVATHLHASIPLTVKIAADGERLRPGTVYLAPDHFQLGVSGKTRIRIVDGPPVNGFRPSASYLFRSISSSFKDEALAIVLTGMGDDGTKGLADLRHRGGRVIAQDEKTSAVFGMPKAAVQAGLVDFVLPLESIPEKMISLTCGNDSEQQRR